MKKEPQAGKQAPSQKIIASFEIFPWISEFETGIPVIDEQHRTLVRLLNGLARDLANPSEEMAFEAIFRELGDYAVYHFETEEGLMRDYIAGDVLESGHLQVHRKFVEEISLLKQHSQHEPASKSIEEIVVFLSRWLANHILNADRRMTKVVLAIQAGATLAEAKIQADVDMSGTIKELNDTVLRMYAKLSTRTFHLMKEIVDGSEDGARLKSLQSIEWEHIQSVLQEQGGNISATARALHMHRRTLQRKLRKPPE